MSNLRASLIVATALLAALPARADTDVERGRTLAEANCARCHAIGPQGESPHAEAPPFRVLHERYPVENLAEALAEGIVTGHPDMPEFVFSAEEVDAFIAYLQTLE